MSKTFIIRFHHLAYDDYKVTADSKEQAIEMIKSGEHGYYHHETDFLYNNESWFGEISHFFVLCMQITMKRLTC